MEVRLSAASATLEGDFEPPVGDLGCVVFAHGSGSSRHSPRNRQVAAVLRRAGLGTLLADLLTPEEARERARVFDIDLLAARLALVSAWARDQPGSGRLGWFGASTGAAAALRAAAEPDAGVQAIVSRGGRPDLAGAALADVRAPTLLIVGGADSEVLGLNRTAQARLRCENRLTVIPGATHLFEEPGALEQVATLARDWFVQHLRPHPHTRPADG